MQHVVEGIAAALTKAHERGIVHRDIKPANVFMCNGHPRPFVKLVDFGIAKRLEDETMTATNALLGTPAYMSPEQLSGAGEIDHRSDLWALGVLAFHMFAGKPPFRGAHIANIAHMILNEETPRLTAARPDLPPALDAWMARALARDPAARFASAREMAETLAEALGELAYSSTSRKSGAPVVPVAPGVPIATGSGPAVVVMPTGSGAVLVQPPPSHPHLSQPISLFEGEPTTFGPSAITRSPHGGSARLRWWVMATTALGVVLVGAAFRVGAGLRKEEPQMLSTAAAAATAPPPPRTTAPVLTGTVIGASPEPTTTTMPTTTAPPPPAPRAASTTSGARKAPAPRSTTTRRGRTSEDDVGF